MKIKKSLSFDELLEKLRGEEIISSRTDSVPHLSWEEIFEYVERRYELSVADPLKKRVLSHIIACRQCSRAFSYVHDLMSVIETDSIPTSSEESKQKASEIVRQTSGSDVIGEWLKIVRGAAQTLANLVFGENWQLVFAGEMGAETEGHAEAPPSSQEYVLKLTLGSLEGAEVERTSDDRLIVTLNRPVAKGSYLTLLTETGEELQLPVVRPLDRRGRASYDLSRVSETPAFRIVLGEGEKMKEV